MEERGGAVKKKKVKDLPDEPKGHKGQDRTIG